MLFPSRRWLLVCLLASVLSLVLFTLTGWKPLVPRPSAITGGQLVESPTVPSHASNDEAFNWKNLPQKHAVASIQALPTGRTVKIPRIQHAFTNQEYPTSKRVREERLQSVKDSFAHTWKGYKDHAWGRDEVAPISGSYRDTFGGWAATLVDTLDTLWIMGFHDDFNEAVAEVGKIDFTKSSEEQINVFETTIRYLGGFLSAYDLSHAPILLQKAVELGDMLYVTFDTPNRMPVTRWNWKEAMEGHPQEAGAFTLSAEIGSLSLEFTRLSQISGDSKYFDAIQRITDQFEIQQKKTKLPGMWPVVVNAQNMDFTAENTFSLGAMADSLYEYLPKQYLLLGGLSSQYRTLYEGSIDSAKRNNFFRPLNPANLDILISGSVKVEDGKTELDPLGQHLVCFAGGMIAMGDRIFGRNEMDVARKLVDGCIWAYESTATGIMPEVFHAVPCSDNCQWDEEKWHEGILTRHGADSKGSAENYIMDERLSPGFTDIPDRRYILRPEAIESVFILYRITGESYFQDKAWKMFQAIEKHARTDIAHAALDDVTVENPPKSDRMESFWPAETLKYLYLIFSDPSVISLDEYVFNTEAHPLRRPKKAGGIFNWYG